MRKNSLFKRLMAIFLIAVMLVSSGNGFSLQSHASETNTTSDASVAPPADETTESAPGSGQMTESPSVGQAKAAAQTDAPETPAATEPSSVQTQATEQTQATQTTPPENQTTATESQPASTEPATGETKAAQSQETGQTGQSDETKGVETEQSSKTAQSVLEETQFSETETETAGIALFSAGPEVTNFTIEASVNKSQNMSADILSGQSFDYIIGYTVPPIQGEGSYSAISIQVELPEYLSVVPDPESNFNGLSITGQDVKSAYMRERMLTINLNQTLTTGEAKTVTIKLQTDNFKWKDGSKIILNPTLTGKKSGGSTVTGTLAADKKPVVTVIADDGWRIDKSVGTVTSDDNFYYVPYTVKMINTKAGVDADADRYGRLDVNGMQVSDILPTADTGSTDAAGQHIGYAAGGAPVEISDVKMNGQPLASGSDYTVSGGNTQITFNRTAVSADAGSYTKAGTAVPTTYTYTVKYPRAAYITPSNESQVERYWLQNTAKLKYTLLGKNEATDQDMAEIVLGEKEVSDEKQDLTVSKVVLIDGAEYAYTTGYGKCEFTLYSNAQCTKIANNYDGTVAAGEPQTVSESGVITFKDLKPGIYYLKETVIPKGLSNTDAIVRVQLSKDGTVSLPDAEATAEISGQGVKVKNTADSFGAVEFYKYGKNSEGTIAALSGVEFTLTLSGASTKQYKAVSDGDGRVLFSGIPAGSYVLTETSVGANDEYTLAADKIAVTVTGNKKIYPSGLPNADSIEDVNGVPVFENISGKGKFIIEKVNSRNESKKLAGAKFQLYGPYTTETTDIPANAKPVEINGQVYVMTTGEKGLATSEPLPAGYYILEEIEAPENYAVIDKGLTTVLVTANKVSEKPYVIKNDEKLFLDIRKVGTVLDSNNQTVITEDLAGAEFEIYSDAAGKNLVGTIVTYLDTNNISTSCIKGTENTPGDRLHLAPGTYYYKEIKAPDHYQIADSDLHAIKLEYGSNAFVVENASYYGQIHITKADRLDNSKVLSGAKFEIYTDSQCTQPLKDSSGNTMTMVTDNKGTATAMVPTTAQGTTSYWLKEVQAPEGYYPTESVIEVQVESNKQTALTVTNAPLKSIKVVKVDSKVNTVKLKDVTFEIYGPYDAEGSAIPDGHKALATKTTDSDGVCEFTGLVPGKWYYLKEVKPADGYVQNETIISVQTPAGDNSTATVEQIVTNDRLGRLEFEKTTDMDSDGGSKKPLAGVEFTLYKAVSDASGQYQDSTGTYSKGDRIGTKTTAMDGTGTKAVASFEKLVPGTYLLEEKVPEGYAEVAAKLIHVTPGYNQGVGYESSPESERVIANTAVMGKFALDKVSSIDPDTHIQATFDIFKADAQKQPVGERLGTITTTGKEEVVVSGWMAPGDYVLVETSVTGDYTMDSTPKFFTVTAGKTTQLTGANAAVNVPKGKVTVSKKAEFAISGSTGGKQTYPLTGAVLKLYKKTGANNYFTDVHDHYDNPAQIFDLTSTSEMTSDLLDAGQYWIVEETFPEGYQHPVTAHSMIVKINGSHKMVYVVGECEVKAGAVSAGDINTVEVMNSPEKGKIRVNKYGFTVANPLAGAQFEVYKKVDENTEGAIQIFTGTWAVKVKVTASTDEKGFIMESGTSGKGSAVTIDIEPGTYYVREVDTSKIVGGPWYPFKEWSDEIIVSVGHEAQVDFFNYTMHGEGVKTGEDGRPLAGATFAAFANKARAEAFQSYVQSQHVTTNSDAKAQLIKDLKEEGFLWTHDIIAVSTASESDGKFTFDGLVPGETYQICEVVAPDGYALNTEIFEAKVNADGVGFESQLEVSDYKLGRLTVEKYTVLNGSEFSVEGVNFKVYRAAEAENGAYTYDGKTYNKLDATPVASGTSDAKGIYTSILLEEGTYIVEESVPDESPVRKPVDSDVMDSGASNNEGSRDYVVITIKRNQTTNKIDDKEIRFYNPATYGKFTFKKVDQTGAVITDSDVTFKLYRNTSSDKSNPEWTYIRDITASKTAQNYVSDFLPAGDYKLVEVSAPGYTIGYGESSPLLFTITGGKITGSLTGDHNPSDEVSLTQPLVLKNIKQGSLELLKVGMLDGKVYDNNLEGAQFILYKALTGDSKTDCVEANIVVTSNTTNAGINKTGGNGKCKWNNLDSGKYWLVEIAPDPKSEAGNDRYGNPKYEYDSTPRLVTIDPGANVIFNKADASNPNHRVENVTTYGRLQIKKVDANNTSKGLSGAKFEVYKDKACTDPAYGIANQKSSFTTNAQGIGLSYPLPAGTYWLKEVTYPSGYIPSEENRITGPYVIESNKITDLTTDASKFITNAKKFEIVVTKKATNAGTSNPVINGKELLGGATIGLFATKKDAEDGTNWIQKEKTDANGVAKFAGLTFDPSGKSTYWVRELETPSGDYVLNTTPYEVLVEYGDGKTIIFKIKAGAADEGILYNDEKGRVTIKKQGQWRGISDSGMITSPMSGVMFSLYSVSGYGAVHADTDKAAATMTTGADGTATSSSLTAGWYELVETPPEGYAKAPSYWVEIRNNEITQTLYDSEGKALSNVIVNEANKGKFVLYKWDGDAGSTASDLTPLTEAVFVQERKLADGSWEYATDNDPEKSKIIVQGTGGVFKYESGYIEPGTYRITEIQAPTWEYDDGGTQQIITFALNKQPLEFTIEKGVTLKLNAYNSPQGSITLVKYGQNDPDDNNAIQPLAGASFKLYTDADCKNEVSGSLKYTGADGICVWDKLDPGTYYIKETADGKAAVNAAGFGISDEVQKVVIESGALVKKIAAGDTAEKDKIYKNVTFVNASNAGKIRILKTNADGSQKLAGAEFKIYAQTASGQWENTPLQTLTITDADHGIVSDFLKAAPGGTKYKIVETHAPDGYTLDGEFVELEQIVTVYPYHTPSLESVAGSHNCFVFANKKDDSLVGLKGGIHKQIREAGSGDDETTFTDSTVTASESLLTQSYTVEFKVDGYADGTNEKLVKDLVVTDNRIGLEYGVSETNGIITYKDMTVTDKDYTINSLTVNTSVNTKAMDQKVGADIYVQHTMAEKASGTWTHLTTFQDLGTPQTVSFDSQKVVGVKVVYTNTLEYFRSEGIILNVTFANRGEWSTEGDHEVRRINNTADITWKDTYLDGAGQEQVRERNNNSNKVEALIPSFTLEIPEIEIDTKITDSKMTFYSGDEINFSVMATNKSTPEADRSRILRQPVLSFKLPAQTALDESKYQSTMGFLVRKVSPDGSSVIIPQSMYTMTMTEVPAALADQGNGSYTEDPAQTTTQYAFAFAENELTQLAEGESIKIEFRGYISYEPKGGFDLVIPAYLSSSAKIPRSSENPKGLSFVPYSQQLRENPVADQLVSDDLSYVNDADSRVVTNTTAVKLLKSIGVKGDDGQIHWLSRGAVATVHPAGEIYYKLTLYNYTATYIENARFVDVFPGENDTYITSMSEGRGTNIPFGPGYENMTLLNASAGGNIAWYSTNHDWSQRNSSEQTGILKPLYYKSADWSGWSSGIMSSATALGAEVDFTNGGTTQGLAPSGTYEIVISMRAPGYTADKISEYYGKFMDNSAAVSVITEGSSAQADEIAIQFRVEPNKVRATMDLPTGSIGDYVWFDDNADGIQDAGESPVEGMTVELWQTRYYTFNGTVRRETKLIQSTVTDQDGKYLFDGLPCQYLSDGAASGSENPEDYVGGEFYSYKVKFIRGDRYADYTFTQQEAGNDRAVDSNPDANGETKEIQLHVISNADGSLSGESNMTIDAGILTSYALGDYVWLDKNCNGVQDSDEVGVPGVPVFLYKVDGPDGTVKDGQQYLERTVTDADGRYWFDNLMEGYYVVEFDISNLKKLTDNGYTYRYDFTDSKDVSGGEMENDSDARHAVDTDGRIRRTNVIALNEDALRKANLNKHEDPRWDAGLVTYSAIGGFVFDDQDYDDLQSLYIPLEGTRVELFEVNPDGTRSDQPVATQVVGADGRYFFDHLAFGTEYKDYSIKFTYPEGYYGVDGNADGDEMTSDPLKDSHFDSDVHDYTDGTGKIDRTRGYIGRIRLGQDMVTTTWDAGARKYSAIGDYVWIDENKNGLQDAGETPVPDVLVVLQSRKDSQSEWEYGGHYTWTDENGRYEFRELESSDKITKEYRVVFVLSETTKITTLNSGDDSAIDSDAIGTYMKDIVPVVVPGQAFKGGYVTTYIKPGYGEEDMTWDAGIVKVYGAIGDYVWYDDDHDGIQDSDEKGVPNVPVILEMNTSGNTRDDAAWVVVGEMPTDENGRYLFEGLESGYYRVKFQIPEDYVNTRYNRGTGENGNAVDSDASRDAGNRWYYTAAFFLPEGTIDLTWDAGIYKPTTRTETETKREPVDREVTTVRDRVTRTTRTVTRTRRGVRTGDYAPLAIMFAIAVVSLGTIIVVVRRKKKKDGSDAGQK